MSDKSLTIRIKIGNNEIELSGSPEDISKMLEDVPKIVDKISVSFSTINPATTAITSSKQESSKTIQEELPTISAQVGASCPDAVVAVLSTSWGRERPRYLSEILEAMKVNALHFPMGTVKGRLTDLTKRGVLRRIRGEKGYGYILAK